MTATPNDDVAWADWAVQRWAGFPVDRVPRPLVLLGETAHPRNGFRSQRAKRAYSHGWIETRVPLPDELLDMLGRAGDRPDGEPPIVITASRRCPVEQPTDRGRRSLPGWELQTPDTRGPIVVLDPEVAAGAWAPAEPLPPRPDGRDPPGDPFSPRADLAGDGRTLTVSYMAGSGERHRIAEVVESRQAVAVVPRREDTGAAGPRTLVGYRRRLTVALNAPLGNRVLVDLHGNASEVTLRAD